MNNNFFFLPKIDTGLGINFKSTSNSPALHKFNENKQGKFTFQNDFFAAVAEMIAQALYHLSAREIEILYCLLKVS